MHWRDEKDWQRLDAWLRAPQIDRREWLKLLGASIALATGAGCSRDPVHEILPYDVTPADLTPGVAKRYATHALDAGAAIGLLVECHDGRPTKVDGNPDHPASLGASGPAEQALALGVYDPNRARAIRGPGVATWDTFVKSVAADRPDGGAGLAVILEPTSSPLVLHNIDNVRKRFPAARFSFHSINARRGPRAATKAAFGRELSCHYAFDEADVVVSLDADFLAHGPMRLRYARDFVGRRRPRGPNEALNRLYVVEPSLTVTGAFADHRKSARASEIIDFARALLAAVKNGGHADKFVAAVARDLTRAGARGVVVAGDDQDEDVHLAAIAINDAIGARAVHFTEPAVRADVDGAAVELSDIANEMRRGAIDTAVIIDCNVMYSAPADVGIADALRRVKTVVYVGEYEDETAGVASWFLPLSHALERWGDARAWDGTISIAQPTLRPLYESVDAAKVLTALAGDPRVTTYDALRALHINPAQHDFEARWRETLRRGVMGGSAFARVDAKPKIDASALLRAETAKREELEVAFAHEDRTLDGRFANLSWLLELPHPITKQTWGNAALVSRETAERIGAGDGEIVRVEARGRTLEIPIMIVMGEAAGSISIAMGFGRSGGLDLARGVGANASALRATNTPRFVPGVKVTKTGRSMKLARTQEHWSMEGRDIALSRTAEEYAREPDFTRGLKGPPESLFAPRADQGAQWAMAIDLGACIGCSACVVACQAENNILVVGKEGVEDSREMHWLRIDAYFSGDPADPAVITQPMACQHCEKAPCEYVCPVNATVHSPDGLNEMVYNRCVGTRFCQNNCPYKVRRFNWFDWIDHQPANRGIVKLQRNPDVTVRDRGVMEKCTYCVQRIREAEISARDERRRIATGEIKTACQEACPTQAITFGSLGDPKADVNAWRRDARSYAVLHDQGTNARTMYLARIKNPNPEIEGGR